MPRGESLCMVKIMKLDESFSMYQAPPFPFWFKPFPSNFSTNLRISSDSLLPIRPSIKYKIKSSILSLFIEQFSFTFWWDFYHFYVTFSINLIKNYENHFFFNSSKKKNEMENQQSSADEESKGGRKEEMVEISFWQKMSEDLFSMPFFDLIWIFLDWLKGRLWLFSVAFDLRKFVTGI